MKLANTEWFPPTFSILYRSSRSKIIFKIGVHEKFCNIHRTTRVLESLLIKWQVWRPATLSIKRLQHRCFPVNIAKFLRTAFFYRTPPVVASILWHIILNSINRRRKTNQTKWFVYSEKIFLEVVAQRCSVKKVFLKISQNSQENTCASVFF